MNFVVSSSKIVFLLLQFKDLMLSVDPPDDDDSDENQGRQSPNATTTYTIKQRPESGDGDASNSAQSNHVGGEAEERKDNNDVIMIDGDGERETNEKESPNVRLEEVSYVYTINIILEMIIQTSQQYIFIYRCSVFAVSGLP